MEAFRDRATALGGNGARPTMTCLCLGRRMEGAIPEDDATRRISVDPMELISLEREEGRPRGALAREVERWADRFALAFAAGPSARVPFTKDMVALLAERVRRRPAPTEGTEDMARTLWRALAEMNVTLEPDDVDRLMVAVRDEVAGLGPLEALLRDASVSDILVVGPDRLFIDRGGAIEPVEARFAGEEHLRAVIERMVGRVGRRVDFASPLCDLRLPDGSRVNVVLPPVALDGSIVTIRRFRQDLRAMADLTAAGALTDVQAAFLRDAVRARRNLVISGPAGAGKTTLLNVLAAEVPTEERLITLEDAAELSLSHPHVVRLETRPPNAEGAGAVTMSDLVVNALRMRPDRLIIGECRGAEALPMLQAMNTGHAGSMTTLHANSAGDTLSRLEGMALLGAPNWPAEVVRRQIASALDLVVHLERIDGQRRLSAIGRVVSTENGLELEPVEFRSSRTSSTPLRGGDRGGVSGEVIAFFHSRCGAAPASRPSPQGGGNIFSEDILNAFNFLCRELGRSNRVGNFFSYRDRPRLEVSSSPCGRRARVARGVAGFAFRSLRRAASGRDARRRAEPDGRAGARGRSGAIERTVGIKRRVAFSVGENRPALRGPDRGRGGRGASTWISFRGPGGAAHGTGGASATATRAHRFSGAGPVGRSPRVGVGGGTLSYRCVGGPRRDFARLRGPSFSHA